MQDRLPRWGAHGQTRPMDKTRRHTAIASAKVATAGPPPKGPINPFFGVGPITDMAADEADAAETQKAFEDWISRSYRKQDAADNDIGAYTVYELSRSMHRGAPGDAILADMAHHIHRYFGFPAYNRMAIGVGGGHSGFTAAALHFINPRDSLQGIFIDTRHPGEAPGGFFRQLWGTQIIEMMRTSPGGSSDRLHFADEEGVIPSPDALDEMGVKLVFGVGHETSGATTYNLTDIRNLIDWIDRDPARNHAIIDATSLLGAMPWPKELITEFLRKCNFFTPFQKAIGGATGYYAITLTPSARTFIDINQVNPGFAIPRQHKIAVPENPAEALTSRKSVDFGPVYDPQDDRMMGGVINTFSALALAQTTFALLRMERKVGPVETLNQRSLANRDAIEKWIAREPLFELAVADPSRRGCAVTLIKASDPDIEDADIHSKIIEGSKAILGFEGMMRPDGTVEPGLDVARYVNAFPGTPGDYRAWIGGIRPTSDIIALLDCIRYAYLRAKIVVLSDK